MSKALSTMLRQRRLDEPLFRNLIYVLHHDACGENVSMTARMLDCSRPKAQRLVKEVDEELPITSHWPIWMNGVLRDTLMQISSILLESSRRKYKQRGREVRAKLKGFKVLGDGIKYDDDINPEEDAHIVVLATLVSAPGMSLEFRQLCNAVGFSPRVVRAAAHRLGLIRETTGFGPEKKSTYRVPYLEDLED